jgi:hypothetical protein
VLILEKQISHLFVLGWTEELCVYFEQEYIKFPDNLMLQTKKHHMKENGWGKCGKIVGAFEALPFTSFCNDFLIDEFMLLSTYHKNRRCILYTYKSIHIALTFVATEMHLFVK